MADDKLTSSDFADIQGMILSGYAHLKCSRFLFLQMTDAGATKAWLRSLLPEIATAARRPKGAEKPAFAVNIAFTHPGLAKFGLPADALNIFPREFQEGMSSGERPRVLGDTEDSAPQNWDVGGSSEVDKTFHILLMLYATTPDVLTRENARLSPGLDAGKLSVVYCQDTGRISDYEPFGFRDGISQPFIAGAPGEPIPGQVPINAGEFLLGYENGYGSIPLTPLVSASDDPGGVLAPATPSDSQEVAPGDRDFGRNGTYLVFRKLAQDVDGFWSFIDKHATEADGESGGRSKELFAAKVVGRWKEGSPIVLAPDGNVPELTHPSKSNDFLYMPTDPDGLACPVGAHIRRANPRDSLLPTPERSKVLSNRHRILRRGRHYEDRRTDTWDPRGVERGLCFIALNADIQRQFEFVQQTWVNSTKFSGLFDCRDPLVGENDGTGHFAIPAEPVRRHLTGIPRFIRVRGGGYFFTPGIRALRYLAQG